MDSIVVLKYCGVIPYCTAEKKLFRRQSDETEHNSCGFNDRITGIAYHDVEKAKQKIHSAIQH
jgi:hypothetical protein